MFHLYRRCRGKLNLQVASFCALRASLLSEVLRSVLRITRENGTGITSSGGVLGLDQSLKSCLIGSSEVRNILVALVFLLLW